MTVALRPSSRALQPSPVPDDLLLPRLAYRPDSDPAFLRFGRSSCSREAAAVALSRTLDAIITRGGRPLSREDLGRAGMSIHRAWDDAAGNLIALSMRDGVIPISLMTPADRAGFGWRELIIPRTLATSWLAHPRTFTVVDGFLTTRLDGRPHYRITDPAAATLLVTTLLPQHPSANHTDVVVYQDGFPVPVSARLATRVAPRSGASFLLAG